MSDVFRTSIAKHCPDALMPEKKAKITILYNQVDHDSLMASILLTDLLTDTYVNTVSLQDVRATLPPDQDIYLWMSCGNAGEFMEYYGGNHDLWQRIFATTSNTIKPILQKSLYFYPSHEHTLLQNVIMDELFVGKCGYTVADYLQFSAVACMFHSTMIKAEDTVRYYRALDSAYKLAIGYDRTFIDDVLDPALNSIVTLPDVQFYATEQCALSNKLAPMFNKIRFGGIEYVYLTYTGVEVFNLVRRLCLSNRCFFHVSTGAYGQVVYSNTSSAKRFMLGKGLLYLHA